MASRCSARKPWRVAPTGTWRWAPATAASGRAWTSSSDRPPWAWACSPARWCSSCPASADSPAAVVLVMSVIAAMWSQSIPWRSPSTSAVSSSPSSSAIDPPCGAKHRSAGPYCIALQEHSTAASPRTAILRSIPMSGSTTTSTSSAVRERLRRAGMRWTPQRRLILEVIEATDGHITGAELVERCRARDPDTTPSTVYRTLDVLEELGYVRHSHAADGREEFHIRPVAEHGHLQCRSCGRTWELDPADAATVTEPIRTRLGFTADVGHLTITGLCADCGAGREADRP